MPGWLTDAALCRPRLERLELAAFLEQSLADPEVAPATTRLWALTPRRARAVAGVALAGMLASLANYLVRLYTCAPGEAGAKRAMVLTFAVGGLLTLRLGTASQRLLIHAYRLGPAAHRTLAAALRRSAQQDRAREAHAAVWGVSRRQWAAAVGVAVLLPGLSAVDYGLRLHSCTGGAHDAAVRTALTIPLALVTAAYALRSARRVEQDLRAEYDGSGR